MPISPEHITANQDALMALVGTFADADEYRLYDEDPTETGVELSATGGYAPVAEASVTWAVVSGEPAVGATATFTASGAWAEVPQWWGLHDADDALRAYGPLEGDEAERSVEAAGSVPLELRAYFDTTDEVLD